jgi:exopolysaccharide production protein ExoY
MQSSTRTQAAGLLSLSLDFCCIAAAFGAASLVVSNFRIFDSFGWPDHRLDDIRGWPLPYVVLLLASLILWGTTSAYFDIYRREPAVKLTCSIRRLTHVIVLWLGAIAAAIFFLKPRGLSRQFTMIFLVLAGLAIILKYFAANYISGRIASRAPNRNAIVFGEPATSMGMMNLLARLRTYESVTLGDETHAIAGSSPDHSPSSAATDVFVMPSGDGTAVSDDAVLRLLKQCSVVHIVPAVLDTALFRYSIGEVGGIPVITFSAGRLAPWQAGLKRLVDLAFAVAALMIFAPLMGLIALAVKLTSVGPVFFRQERLGKDGRCFQIFKFRTMRADAEALLKADPQLYNRYRDSNFKLTKEEDFRVTPLGRFLRSSSLDELPQLFNVLTGDMSLVGPRPIVPDEIEQYDDYDRLLLSVKPGMTGYWQINGRSLITDYAARVRLDIEYIRDQSLRGDLQIMLKTVGAVTRMEGAH